MPVVGLPEVCIGRRLSCDYLECEAAAAETVCLTCVIRLLTFDAVVNVQY